VKKFGWYVNTPGGSARQRGISVLLFTVGALVILASAGLALDLGLGYLTKTRLQNALDAAALAGAKRLNEVPNEALASETAVSVFQDNMSAFAAGASPTVEFSPTLSPFVAGGSNPVFVRVRASGVPSPLRLVSLLPGVGNTLSVGGSAVAGPASIGGEFCGAIPIAMCGVPGDDDCSDGACFGFGGGASFEIEVKGDGSKLGSGNYGLVVIDCTGASCVREAMAGGREFCFRTDSTLTTEPGVQGNPMAQGLNTRFGVYQGPVSPADYPPDKVTAHNPVIDYDTYLSRLGTPASWDFPDGVAQRRLILLPVVDCDPPVTGRTSVPVLGGMCMFLTRRPHQTSGTFYAQIVERCQATGSVPEHPDDSGSMGFKIILYKDPDSRTS
jgi:hypothetical protein